MQKFIYIIFLTSLLFSSPALSQGEMTVEEYIDTYKRFAIEEMKKHRIPASITLAQGILESGSGNSDLARLANNHFGIKCHKEWTGKTYQKDDDAKDECFRKYHSAEESYRDHSDFLTSRDRYKLLFSLDIDDYKGWARGLKEAGYATNPRYPEMLIRIIEENGLKQFDRPEGQRSAGPVQSPKPKAQTPEPDSEAPDVFKIAGKGGNDRIIFLNNGVQFILAREGDNFNRIAAEFGISGRQIREYNDLTGKDKLKPGSKVYLERKKSKTEFKTHTIRPGETLHSISQDYGIRLNVLCRKNDLGITDRPEAGVRLRLR